MTTSQIIAVGKIAKAISNSSTNHTKCFRVQLLVERSLAHPFYTRSAGCQARLTRHTTCARAAAS
eukprot:1606801-Amphidinium_carterae.1